MSHPFILSRHSGGVLQSPALPVRAERAGLSRKPIAGHWRHVLLRLFRVVEGPEFTHPAYMVFPREADSEVLGMALHGLRELAADVQSAMEG